MKVFQNLTVKCTEERTPEFVQAIENRLPPGWRRDQEMEKRSRTRALSDSWYFVCTEDSSLPSALVALSRRDPDTLDVANIVPQAKGQLSHDEYNNILRTFYDQAVRPVAEALGLSASLSKSEKDLQDWMPPDAAEKLRAFSGMANMSTGSSHPMDRERWIGFIVSLSKSEHSFDSGYLIRWLQDEGWDEDTACDLASEYEFAMELLAYCGVNAG